MSCQNTALVFENMARQLLLLSNSTNHGSEYLEHCEAAVRKFFGRNGVSKVLFIPYACKDHDGYADKVRSAFKRFEIEVESIHESADTVKKVKTAKGLFIGGGNTFRLLTALYNHHLIEPIRKKVLQDGTLYMGSSAGTNVATTSICTTNDMPIIYPPSFEALRLVPFNINPHYLDADSNSQHMGETREKRIEEYHEIPGTPPVLGLREGSWLEVDGDKMTLCGSRPAKLFVSNKPPKDYEVSSRLDHLLNLEDTE